MTQEGRSMLAFVALIVASASVAVAVPAGRSLAADAPATVSGYRLVAADGGIFSFGDAGFHGSTGDLHLNQPIVGMATTPSGNGYWLVAADGGIFSFGDAGFHGSTAAMDLAGVVTNIMPTPDGNGYWLATTTGHVVAFGAAADLGSANVTMLGAPIVGLLRTASGNGYWLVGTDGGVLTFGDAAFFGSLSGAGLAQPVIGIATPWGSAMGAGALRLLSKGPARPATGTVALTFDDGPNPTWTPQVLDVLDAFGVQATFFVVGSEATKHPDLVREIVARGHRVENHSWSHPELPKLDDAAIASELTRTSNLIQSLTGARPDCMRPPDGATDPRVVGVAQRLGLAQILWNVDPKDYTRPGAAVIATRTLGSARAGNILLLHDGGGDRSQTVAALPTIITGLRARGLGFTRLC